MSSQIICWGSYVTPTYILNTSSSWSKEEFLCKTEGSAIRRIGYDCWLRNVAVALGNAPASQKIREKLQKMISYPSAMVKEHVQWALERQTEKAI